MPEHLRALVFILVLATVVFAFARAPASAMAMAGKDFDRRRNLWFALTLAAFLAHNVWIFLLVAAVLLLAVQRREQNKLAMYFFVLFALPPIAVEISGMGLVNALFDINYVRLLALTVLLPAYLAVRRLPDADPFGRLLPDKLLAGYLILDILLMFEHRTFTSILRDGFFYAFIDIFLPYYVASRSLRNLREFRDALMSFVVAAMVLSAVLFLEFARTWLLYSSLEQALGANVVGMDYLARGTRLRALGTVGHAIAAGYVIAVALGIYFYLRTTVSKVWAWGLGFMLLIAGLIGPVSRGPWVGAAAMILVFVATGPAAALGLARLGLLGLAALPFLLGTDAGSVIIDHLPFVGTLESGNVTGRQILAMVSYQVFWENPLLGTYNVLAHPAMEALRGGDGLIDLVNTFVVVGLVRGIVGLSLFAGFFLAVIFGVYRGMRSLADKNDENHVLGRTFMAVLVGILVIIATVSPILLVPTIYWLVGGLGVAYAGMLARGRVPAASGPAQSRPDAVRLANGQGAFPRSS